ncbi:hypothetical protein IC216_14245 [Clostridioides sp. ES-S-0145-01]|uniref:hypothetical protein n=1 Tax=Clostridioides sp. ES-S-0145-01 TaxID=2770784 RepID=UPI001D10DDF1|nr:hypothetical protein [Clostridioides sp. ES-S-0145-01]
MSYIYKPKNDYEKTVMEEYDKLNKKKYEDKYCNMKAHQIAKNIMSDDILIKVCMQTRKLRYKATCIGLSIMSIFIYLFLSISTYNASKLPLKCLFTFGILLFTGLLYSKIKEIRIKYKYYNLIDFSALKILEDMKNIKCSEIKKEFFEEL